MAQKILLYVGKTSKNNCFLFTDVVMVVDTHAFAESP